MTIAQYFRPTKLAHWMGANGPAIPTAPTFKQDVDFIASLGANWCRLNADMAWFWRPEYFPKFLDAIRYVVSTGMIPLPVISGAPDTLAQITGGGGSGALPTDAGLEVLDERLVAPLQALFEAGCRPIETHNEWDGPGMHGNKVDIARMVKTTRLLHSAWHAIGAKARNADVMCIVGGTSTAGMPLDGKPLFAPDAYLRFLTAQGAAVAFDGVGHHAGSWSYDPHDPAKVDMPWNGFYQTRAIANRVQAVRPGARVFVTEIPWPDDKLGGEEKAYKRARVDLLHMVDFMQRGWVGPVLVYHGCRDGSQGHDNSSGTGMRRADGTEKAICRAFREYAAVPWGRRP